MVKDYDISMLYHLTNDNIVEDTLRRLSMGSVSHVEDNKKKLAQEVHQLARLGICLVDTEESDIWVQSSSKSSLVFEVKEKKSRDLSFVKLKESVQN